MSIDNPDVTREVIDAAAKKIVIGSVAYMLGQRVKIAAPCTDEVFEDVCDTFEAYATECPWSSGEAMIGATGVIITTTLTPKSGIEFTVRLDDTPEVQICFYASEITAIDTVSEVSSEEGPPKGIPT